MDIFLQLVTTGILVGSVYGLVALGWVVIYKCSGVLNLAMGELTLIGGYVCLSLYGGFCLPFLAQEGLCYPGFVKWMGPGIALGLGVVGSLIIGFLLGLLTERLFLRKMIGEPILAVIMVTVGLAFFFKGVVFLIWDTDLRVFTPPVFPSADLRIGGQLVDGVMRGGIGINQVYMWAFFASMLLMLVFILFFKYTRWGLAMQACADDEMAALSLGVSAKFVYALAWGIAFMSAGVGGTVLGNINGLNQSVSYLGLLVLPAVVFGGLNSIPGAIVGGITIGLLQNLAGGYLDQFFPGGVKEIAPFVFMVVFLLFKPYGLWGWERIERV